MQSLITWLEQQMAAARALTPEQAAKGFSRDHMEPVKEGDRVLGQLSDDLKRLFSLIGVRKDAVEEKLEKGERELREKLKTSPMFEVAKEHRRLMEGLSGEVEEADFLSKVFWFLVHLEVPTSRNVVRLVVTADGAVIEGKQESPRISMQVVEIPLGAGDLEEALRRSLR